VRSAKNLQAELKQITQTISIDQSRIHDELSRAMEELKVVSLAIVSRSARLLTPANVKKITGDRDILREKCARLESDVLENSITLQKEKELSASSMAHLRERVGETEAQNRSLASQVSQMEDENSKLQIQVNALK